VVAVAAGAVSGAAAVVDAVAGAITPTMEAAAVTADRMGTA